MINKKYNINMKLSGEEVMHKIIEGTESDRRKGGYVRLEVNVLRLITAYYGMLLVLRRGAGITLEIEALSHLSGGDWAHTKLCKRRLQSSKYFLKKIKKIKK